MGAKTKDISWKIVIYGICLMLLGFNFGLIDKAKATDWVQVPIPFGTVSSVVTSAGKSGDNIYVGVLDFGGGSPGTLWRSSDGDSWTEIVSDGFGDPMNISIVPGVSVNWGFLILNSFDTSSLASTVNPNGLQIWQKNGDNWTKLVGGGFGNVNNLAASGAAAFGNYLYVSTWNMDDGTEIWRTLNGTDWEKTNTSGFGTTNNWYSELVEFNGYLYSLTSNWAQGAQIWRSADGSTWEQINQMQLTGGPNISLQVGPIYNNELYLGTFNIYGGQLWKTSNGTEWTKVTGAGFSKSDNVGLSPQLTNNGYLYLSTYNLVMGGPALIMQKLDKKPDGYDKIKPYIVLPTSNGAEIWASSNGSSWNQINVSGFGSTDNIAIGNSFILGDYIFATSLNITGGFMAVGNQLWKSKVLGLPNPSDGGIIPTSVEAVKILPKTGRHLP